MKIQRFLAVACMVSVSLTQVQAAVPPPADLSAAVAQISNDSTVLSQWNNDQFRRAVAYNSTAGNVVPSQLKLFGVELGVEGVASVSKVDKDSFHQLPTTLIDPTKIDMLDRLPIPLIVGHAKIGLPLGLDGGVRVGGIPTKTFDSGSTHYEVANSMFGLDLRKKIIEEGMAKPFGLTAGLNYTHAKGHFLANSPYTANTSYTAPSGQTYTPTLSATGNGRTDWKTDSVGVQAFVNKQILFFNPYIGASANRNWGTVSTQINNIGTVTLTDPNNSSNTASQAVAAGGSAAGHPTAWDIRALVGFELSVLPFVKLGIHGEIANENRQTVALGLRAQFH